MKNFILASLIFLYFVGGLHAGVREISSPAGILSQTPYLFAKHATLYMTWLEKTTQGHALKFAKFDGKQWSKPSVIVADVPFFVNWADFPSILALDSGMLVAHWLQQSGKGKYAYDVMISVSKDSGKTWSAGMRPHRDNIEGEHGFVSLIPAASGFEAIWLDSRKFNQKDLHSMQNEMQLMSSVFANSSFGKETLLDSRVCDCCQTSASFNDKDAIVMYRDRSDQEIRDISFVKREGNNWTSPKPLHADQWKIAACPVNGPAVSINGKNVAATWFTAAGDKPQILVSFSSDSGSTFGKPIRVDAGKPVGRVDVKYIADGSAILSWLENKEKGAEIMVRKIKNGKAGEPIVVAPSTGARASGFPRLAAWGNGAVIAWTYVGDDSTSVKLAIIE
jgi:hypothetical protein